MKYQLKKSFVFEGKEFSEIDVPIEDLTGADIESIWSEMEALTNSGQKIHQSTVWKYFAARASKLPIEFFGKMSGVDYMALSMKVWPFLAP